MHDHARGLARLGKGRGIRQQLGQLGDEQVEPLPDRCGHDHEIAVFLLALGRERLLVLHRGCEVDLVADNERDLVEERGIVRFQLVANDLVVALRIRRGEVHDVNQQPVP